MRVTDLNDWWEGHGDRYALIEVTTFGSLVSQYIHSPTGIWFEDWCDWRWIDPLPSPDRPS